MLCLVSACETVETPILQPLPPVPVSYGATSARVDGVIGTGEALPAAQFSRGQVRQFTGSAEPAQSARTLGGDVQLNFVDTDIREVVAQVLGRMLGANYTIDAAVQGNVTLRTNTPIPRTQLLTTLQALLAQNGAGVVQSNGLYRVGPAAAGASAATDPAAGAVVVPLRYASAEDLAKVLQPFAGAGGKVVAGPGRNVLLISGEPQSREVLSSLIQSFDIDQLSGQSYALFPVASGNAKDFAVVLSEALRSQGGVGLAGQVRAMPLERINAVLVVANQPRYIDEARKVFSMVERGRRQTLRGWSVYYLQSSRALDTANLLQQAFTPGRVTAIPTQRGSGNAAPGRGSRGREAGTDSFSNVSMPRLAGAGSQPGAGIGLQVPPPPIDPAQNPSNPLLGGLDPIASIGLGTGPLSGDDQSGMKIIPNPQNNAIIVYATAQERDTLAAMLRKIDILPLQVRIDATIAEVTLNDSLQYGTQFFFKAGINGALNFSPAGAAASQLASAFPGFVLSGPNNGGAALNALQAITQVRVLSSPQVLVVDNETARLQVGDLVPYLTSSSQSIISANAPVINGIEYRATGVIMEVTPRINSGGLVTLDISQEVSDVGPAAPGAVIGSPTFTQRSVSSRVVVQDGQTIGLAGLIRDTASRGNSGIPFLKDVPLLGLLAGSQDNKRGRTELLVLITPHVVHDYRDARALTEDMREQLINAAAVPGQLGRLGPSGSSDPGAPVRRELRLER